MDKKFLEIQPLFNEKHPQTVMFHPCVGENSFPVSNAEILLARAKDGGTLKVYRSDGQTAEEHPIAAGEIQAVWFGVTNGWSDTDGNILLVGGPGVEVAILRHQ